MLLPFISSAQKKKGYNRIYPSYSIQGYYDKGSVLYSGTLPENYLHIQNTLGHYWGLQYERVTRYGLLLGCGLQYGVRRYSLSTSHDLSNYDSNARNDLRGFIARDTTMLSFNYWGYRLMVGYKMKLNKDIAIVAKAGVTTRFFSKNSWEDYEVRVSYLDDNGITTHDVEIANVETRFGRNVAVRKRRLPTIVGEINTFEFYLGFEKEINKSLVKNISVGIEATRSWWLWINDGVMTIQTSESYYGPRNGTARIYDRNLSIGLRVAVGLWP